MKQVGLDSQSQTTTGFPHSHYRKLKGWKSNQWETCQLFVIMAEWENVHVTSSHVIYLDFNTILPFLSETGRVTFQRDHLSTGIRHSATGPSSDKCWLMMPVYDKSEGSDRTWSWQKHYSGKIAGLGYCTRLYMFRVFLSLFLSMCTVQLLGIVFCVDPIKVTDEDLGKHVIAGFPEVPLIVTLTSNRVTIGRVFPRHVTLYFNGRASGTRCSGWVCSFRWFVTATSI